MELVKVKNMKARMYKPRTGGGAHLGLEIAECNMRRGLQLSVYGVWGIFSEKLRKNPPTNQKCCSLNCGNEEL